MRNLWKWEFKKYTVLNIVPDKQWGPRKFCRYYSIFPAHPSLPPYLFICLCLSCSMWDLCCIIQSLSLCCTDSLAVTQAEFLRSMWDLSSLTGDWSHVPCIARWILHPWTTREVPRPSFVEVKGLTGKGLRLGNHIPLKSLSKTQWQSFDVYLSFSICEIWKWYFLCTDNLQQVRLMQVLCSGE